MVSKTSRVNIRVSDELLTLLEEIGERKGLTTISDVIRESLERYADEEGDSWNSDVVKARIPHSTLDEVETLVMAGDATDVSQAINFALNDWVRTRKTHHLQGRDELKKKVGEILAERSTKSHMRNAADGMNKR